MEKMLVCIGSYSEAEDSSVFVCSLNENTGELELLDQASGLKNPTFLNVDASGNKLYAISEGVSEEGNRVGEAVAFVIDSASGKLDVLNRSATIPASSCHIQRSGGCLIQVSYNGGIVGLIALTEDGRIGKLLDIQQHEGHGTNPDRQEKPHPHSAILSPDQQYVFVPDLGLDVIRTYCISKDRTKLEFQGDTQLHPGAGPRHMVFHPESKFAYVINELDSTVTAFSYAAAEGKLLTTQKVSTLPIDYSGENSCAEITISEDGKFVYGANRGHDSIVVYAVDQQSGSLSVVEYVSTQGEHPRHFTLTPGGKFLIAANRDTNNVVTYHVDPASGKLQATGHSMELSKPVCVKAAYFNN
jgi:6-phosphogluconolactonase